MAPKSETIALDIPLIRLSKPKEAIASFNELHERGHSPLEICKSLIEALDADLQSYSVTAVFLSWSFSPDVVAFYIHNGKMRLGRRLAIRLAGKLLANPETWLSIWTALGDTQGLTKLFSQLSVEEVKLLALAIGLPGRRKVYIAERQERIEQLVKALLPRVYPDLPITTQDKRPIQHHYTKILPACSESFITQILDARDEANPLYTHLNRARLFKMREELAKQRVDAAVFGRHVTDSDELLPIEKFLYRDATFAVNAVRLRLKKSGEGAWPRSVSELEVVLHHLRRVMKKRRTSDSDIRSMTELALQVAIAKGPHTERHRCGQLWAIICARWWKQPEAFKSLFVNALKSGIAHPLPPRIGQGYFIAEKGNHPVANWDWTLLRMYCMHVPTIGLDPDTATEYKPLAEKSWAARFFFEVSREQAKHVLSNLYEVNTNFNFLEPEPQSILRLREITPMAHKNFNVDLLMALLDRGSNDALPRAKEAVEKLRKKASTSKEQSDRAEIGKAASAYAIASGDLDLYEETVIWQQRFIRDPLTVKTIFSTESVASKEGIQLLSGVPEPSRQQSSLGDITADMEKGNAILKSFEEAMLLAKREPSFSERDWYGVIRLPESVFRERVSRAKKLQEEQFMNKKAEVFLAVWESGLGLADKLQGNFNCIDALFDALPPGPLATVTKAMLDTGDERRKREDRQPEDSVLEEISYRALTLLASSGQPGLAKQLILRTVLERPDASAWHRQLLSLGFMKRLAADDAHTMLLAFANAISEKLEEQSYVRVGEAKRQKSAPPQSIVKVTTVKYLAQILDKAEFISADAAVEVLIELFRTGSHRDVRLATLDSLLSSLNDICKGSEEVWSSPLLRKILKALEVVIPVVGSINEQAPPREQDWREASQAGTLPEVSDASPNLPPLLSAIVLATNGSGYLNLDRLQKYFMEKLLCPIVEQSQKEHQRWMALFLAKYKADIKAADVPPTPVSPLLWELILTNYPQLAPSQILEDYYRYVTVTLSPPETLRDFNESLKSKSSLRNVAEVQHWLQIYDQPSDDYNRSGLRKLLSVIAALHKHDEDFSVAQKMAVDLASHLLDDYENYTRTWSSFMAEFSQPIRFGHGAKVGELPLNHEDWQKTRRPLLEKVTKQLQEKKRHAEQSPTRNLLPLAFELQVLLLPYPISLDAGQAESQRRTFSTELDSLIISCFQEESSVLQWSKVAAAAAVISTLLNSLEDRVRLANHIGTLREPEMADGARAQLVSALNLVKFRTATQLIQDGWGAVERDGKPNSNVTEEKRALTKNLSKMTQKWQNCADQSILDELTQWRRQNNKIWSQLGESQ